MIQLTNDEKQLFMMHDPIETGYVILYIVYILVLLLQMTFELGLLVPLLLSSESISHYPHKWADTFH